MSILKRDIESGEGLIKLLVSEHPAHKLDFAGNNLLTCNSE
jgi:hypothetical protein